MKRGGCMANVWVVVALILFGSALAPSAAPAQSPTPEAEPWWAVIEAERLNIHSGRAEEFDRIGALKRGDLVRVRNINAFGWAAIAPPQGMHAFISANEVARHREGDPHALEGAWGPQSGQVRTVGRTPVLYPISDDPVQCWRRAMVEADTAVEVIREIQTDRGLFYRIVMPEEVNVFVLERFLRRATPEEIAAWKKRQEEEKVSPQPRQPERVEAAAVQRAVPLEVAGVAPVPAQPQDQPIHEEEEPPVRDEPQPKPHVKEIPPEPVAIDPTPEAEPLPEPLPEPEPHPQPEPTPEPKPAPEPEGDPHALEGARGPLMTLDGLEQLYDELRNVPIKDAEIEPLLRAYQSISRDESLTTSQRRLAEVRIELLEARLEFQKARRKLEDAIRLGEQEVSRPRPMVFTDAHGRPIYSALGVLEGSNIYDGRRLPRLYRLKDPLTGRTVAYLRDDDALEPQLADVLGRRVGVIGDPVRDEALRIEIIIPRHVDELDEVTARP